MKKIRLAIIGTNGIGHAHAKALQSCQGVELTACAARTRASAERFAATYNVPTITTRAVTIADRDDVDAVVICTPNKHHAPQTLAMLKAGKDVLLEKPMAMNVKEAEEWLDEGK